MRYMGIDYGTKRVGVALSDEGGTLAFPEKTLENDAALVDTIAALAREKGVNRVVLGESLDFKNNPNKLMQKIELLKRELEQLGFEVIYEPEHLTSAAAARLQEGRNLDSSAAALILQSYIDRIKNQT